jgi:hypothetical protein
MTDKVDDRLIYILARRKLDLFDRAESEERRAENEAAVLAQELDEDHDHALAREATYEFHRPRLTIPKKAQKPDTE